MNPSKSLEKAFAAVKECGDISKAPKIAIDGPYGAASQDVFDYGTSVCIGAGIGVTPFASLLKSIYYRKRDGIPMNLAKVYFIWICPDMSAFEWFTDLLRHVEKQLNEIDEAHALDIGIYLSRGWNNKLARVCYLTPLKQTLWQ